MKIEPYLFFDGRTEEALAFYKQAVGAETTALMRFSESPDPPPPGMVPPGSENKVMHASVKIGDATVMASDGSCGGKPSFQGFSLTYNAGNEAEADRVFAALSQGGQVTMPLGKTFFAPQVRHVRGQVRRGLDGDRRAMKPRRQSEDARAPSPPLTRPVGTSPRERGEGSSRSRSVELPPPRERGEGRGEGTVFGRRWFLAMACKGSRARRDRRRHAQGDRSGLSHRVREDHRRRRAHGARRRPRRRARAGCARCRARDVARGRDSRQPGGVAHDHREASRPRPAAPAQAARREGGRAHARDRGPPRGGAAARRTPTCATTSATICCASSSPRATRCCRPRRASR